MTEHNVGEQLIDELLADPRKFDDEGRAYDLLQAYFGGLPLETLRPLLRNDDVFIQRAAAFVASELGSQAHNLVDDTILLLLSTDRRVRYYAMEVLTVCCEGEHAEKFAHVARELESDDEVLRALAMRLVSNADGSQLEAAGRFLETSGSRDRTHANALLTLAAKARLEPAAVGAMMRNADPLIRRYGAIAAKRLLREFPHLITEAGASDDSELRDFYQSIVNAQRN